MGTSAVVRVAPLAVGTSEISAGGKLREVMGAGKQTITFSEPSDPVKWDADCAVLPFKFASNEEMLLAMGLMETV